GMKGVSRDGPSGADSRRRKGLGPPGRRPSGHGLGIARRGRGGPPARNRPPETICIVIASKRKVTRPYRQSLSRLWVRHTRHHSPRTFRSPRRLKRRKPRAPLTWPNTGSTTPLRRPYTARPRTARSFARIFSLAVVGAGAGTAPPASGAWCQDRSVAT